MSERMKDEDVGHAMGVMLSACEFAPSGLEHAEARRKQLAMLSHELARARRAEEEKESTIKALADALEDRGGWIENADGGGRWHKPSCFEDMFSAECTPECLAEQDALRLAGRLK